MGLREALEKRKGVSIGVSAILVLAAIAIIFNETRSNQMTRIDRAFYSDDDGQTYFVDEVDKLVPFDHNGKQAYRAYVFKCSSGKQFVGYVSRFSDSARAKLQELKSQPYNQVAQQIADAESAGTEFKKPGDSTWYSQTSAGATGILVPKSPDGSAVLGSAMP
jgi:hypothetical protein